jgi:hypothetical protein
MPGAAGVEEAVQAVCEVGAGQQLRHRLDVRGVQEVVVA